MGVPHPRQMMEMFIKNPKKLHFWRISRENLQNFDIFEKFILGIFRTRLKGVSKIKKIKKNSRKSTDLDEYMLFKKNLIKKY